MVKTVTLLVRFLDQQQQQPWELHPDLLAPEVGPVARVSPGFQALLKPAKVYESLAKPPPHGAHPRVPQPVCQSGELPAFPPAVKNPAAPRPPALDVGGA